MKLLSHISAIMKPKTLFFVKFLCIFWIAFANGRLRGSAVPYAISEIIDKHFSKLPAKHPKNINIYSIGEETDEFKTLIAIRKFKNENLKISICKTNLSQKHYRLGEDEIGRSSVVFFNSVKVFRAKASKLGYTTHKQGRDQHLIHVPGLTTSDILETFPDGFVIDNVNFLMTGEAKSIELVTCFMFTAQTCRELQLTTINRFDADNLTWESSIFYPQKYRNFHGCEIFTEITDPRDTRNLKLLKLVFETALNAKLVGVDTTAYECGNCELTQDMRYIFENYDYCVASAHIYDTFTFAVPSGEPYSDLERMFMMFSVELWIAIALTLLIGVLITLGLNFMSVKVRKFIAGRDIQNPTMNLISIFLTGGQVKTPGRNFARFLFTLFVVWSLIIRTCHQSMLFELMQADLRRPPIDTLEEFFESDLTLHEMVGYEDGSLLLDESFLDRMKMTSNRL